MLFGFSGITTVTVWGGGRYLDTLYSLNASSFPTGNLHNRSFQEEPKRFLTGTKMPKIPLAVTFLERRWTVKAQTLLRTYAEIGIGIGPQTLFTKNKTWRKEFRGPSE